MLDIRQGKVHGVVDDPYRWLEDRRSPETEHWIKRQQDLSHDYFSKLSGVNEFTSPVLNRLDLDTTDQIAKVAGQYFYRRRRKGQEQASLHSRSRAGEERLIVDAGKFGNYATVWLLSISTCGTRVAFGVKQGGEDRISIHVVNLQTGSEDRQLLATGYPRGFTFDLKTNGCFYCQELPDQQNFAIQWNGTEHRDEQVCFEVSRDNVQRLLLIADELHLGAIIQRGDRERLVDLWIAERRDPQTWRCVVEGRPAPFRPILHGGSLYALDYEVPTGRMVELSFEGELKRIVIPHGRQRIRQILMFDEHVFANTQGGFSSAIEHWGIGGTQKTRLGIPTNGTIKLIPRFGERIESAFFGWQSFSQPESLFEFSVPKDREELLSLDLRHKVEQKFDVQHHNYISSDGTQIPITLVSDKKIHKNYPKPVVMTAYGGFGVSMTPRYSVLNTILLELGCELAIPHIRGGGSRNRSGTPTSCDDFVDAAKWLVDEGFTTPSQFAVYGGSHAGLVAAVALTREPTLFKAMLLLAPLLDMLRYEVFGNAARWRHEYGTAGDPNDLKVLKSYSPYHQVEEDTNYPAVMFVAGDRDERCDAAHVRKMVARLQDRSAQRFPIVMDYDPERGHSPSLPLSVRVEALARRIAFFSNQLGLGFGSGGGYESTSG